jgi:hypothetical protein
MTPVNQTSLILLALDKTLVDNANRLKPGESNALLLAAFKTIVGAPMPAEAAVNNNHNGGKANADAIPNSR